MKYNYYKMNSSIYTTQRAFKIYTLASLTIKTILIKI